MDPIAVHSRQLSLGDPIRTSAFPAATDAQGIDRRSVLKGALAIGAGALFLPATASCTSSSSGSKTTASGSKPVEITFASAAFNGNLSMASLVDTYNQSQSRVKVTYRALPTPAQSTQLHQQLVQTLSRKDGSIDVFSGDVIWIAEFAAAGWALALDDVVDSSVRAQYFPGMIQACTWGGKLSALPWYEDVGFLFYRKDLVSTPPTQWSELTSVAKSLMDSHKVSLGFLWQAKQAEILTCDVVEFIGSAGGSILGQDGKSVHIADEPAVTAVQFMYDTMNSSNISPKDVLSWDEDASRRPFTAGQAAFVRNWSFVWAIAQDKAQSTVADKVAVAPLPYFPGGKSAACIGGFQLGVCASSKQKNAAIDFATWMSAPAQQLQNAVKNAFAPTRLASYTDPALIKASPFLAQLKDVITGGTPRPVTPVYPQVSLAIQSGISNALTSGDIKGSLNSTKAAIEKIVG